MKSYFLSNNTKITFLEDIKQAFKSCNAFYISVSFIKKAGLILILNDIKQALNRGAKGKIITSTYQNFTDVLSLQDFYNLSIKYPSFECHIDFNSFGESGFHTKGFIFEYDNYYEVIIGSSNITRFALLKNIEWNTSVISKDKEGYINDVLEEFYFLWHQTLPLALDLIDKYAVVIEYAIEKWDMDYISLFNSTIVPNYMQRKALKEIRRFRSMGVKRALIVAATGSGKTYLAAFDAKNFDARKVLFVVHKETILNDALNTFAKVFGNIFSYGIYTGTRQELDKDFIFATNIMLSKNLNIFEKEEFDYIIIDEVHHAAADTYQAIMNYFNPGFYLGLTATPERMDDKDVYSLFDRNVPYELRLRDALLHDLIVPFHYYGIRDHFVDYSIDDKRLIARQIASSENIDFIVEQIEKYHKKNEKLKCLAFCTTIEHARSMSEAINVKGYNSAALIGTSKFGDRIKAFNDLQNENNALQIIFCVDILNEGVDIPGVNMILFLRPTESSTIFIQQLGRGLRKYQNKDYVTVLDFIGNNYSRSIQIATALGSLSKSTILEKALLIDMINSDFRSLSLPNILINIDQLSKEEMVRYIDKENFNSRKYLESNYYNFKKYLNLETYPKHIEYLNNDIAPDLIIFLKSKINNKKNISYYNFLQKIGEDVELFSNEQINLIDYLSDMLPLVRPYEFFIIRELLNENKIIEVIRSTIKDYISSFDDLIFDHAVLMISKYSKGKILIKNNEIILDVNLENNIKEYLFDLIEYGLVRYDIEFGNFVGKFKLYANYYKDQIMLCLQQESLMFMKGTKIDKDGTVYLFVNLKKNIKVEHLQYKDGFITNSILQWESETNVTVNSTVGQKLINSKIVHVFIRKVESENGVTLPFTYVGTGKMQLANIESNNPKRTIIFNVLLDKTIPDYLELDFNIKEVKDEEKS